VDADAQSERSTLHASFKSWFDDCRLPSCQGEEEDTTSIPVRWVDFTETVKAKFKLDGAAVDNLVKAFGLSPNLQAVSEEQKRRRCDERGVIRAVFQGGSAVMFRAYAELQPTSVNWRLASCIDVYEYDFAHFKIYSGPRPRDLDELRLKLSGIGELVFIADRSDTSDHVRLSAVLKDALRCIEKFCECPPEYTLLPQELRSHRLLMLELVKCDPRALQYASTELRADREVVLAAATAVTQFARCEGDPSLKYASDDLRADREVVLAAVTHNCEALEYASVELRADRGVVLAAVTSVTQCLCAPSLEYASDELRADREVVLAAVTQNGMSLDSASVELRADRGVVLAAVKNIGESLECASDELRADPDVALVAVMQCGDALQYVANDLRGDLERRLAAARHAVKRMRV